MDNRTITVLYGKNPKSMVKELMGALEVEKDIPSKDTLIGLKPNLVVAKPHETGATTSPEMVAGVIEYLKEHGFEKIIILEGSWVGDSTTRAFKTCGYTDVSKRYDVPLYDCQKEKASFHDAGDGMKIEVVDLAMKVGYLINMPVLKGHCQTSMTCALKNMKGILTDREKRKFHTQGLHKPIAYLGKIRKGDLILVDGMCGDLDFEEGGNPIPMNRMLAGKDPVLMDAYAAALMGYELSEVPYIGIAERIGVGSADLSSATIHELNQAQDKVGAMPSRRAKQLAQYVEADQACSACYGSLIHALARMSDHGTLRRLPGKIHIGQGFKGKEMDGIGIGACTAGFSKCLKTGCPPSGKAMIEFLENL